MVISIVQNYVFKLLFLLHGCFPVPRGSPWFLDVPSVLIQEFCYLLINVNLSFSMLLSRGLLHLTDFVFNYYYLAIDAFNWVFFHQTNSLVLLFVYAFFQVFPHMLLHFIGCLLSDKPDKTAYYLLLLVVVITGYYLLNTQSYYFVH